jgi:hypothetical protein
LVVSLATCAVLRQRTPEPASVESPSEALAPRATVRETSAGPAPAARSPKAPAAPIIDSITIEKDEVCEGEENLVTVKAHTPDDTDAFLHVRIGAASGAAIPLRSYLDDRGRPSARQVSVFGKNNVATMGEVPAFRVKPCPAALGVVIEHRLRPNTTAEFDFDARIVSRAAEGADRDAGASFRPRSFTWSFGDGTHQSGHEPHATHSFADRSQETLYSPFLIALEVLDADGRLLKGRVSIDLLNPAFEAFAYKGIVVLITELDPRFPVLSESGIVDQGVRLSHTRSDAVAITKITMTTKYEGRGGRSLPSYPDVRSVLGTTEILPGRGLELRTALDTRLEPDAISRDYALEGRTRDGHPVRGAFSVMKPPPLPTKDRHEPIADPVLLAKVKLARTLLHREFVTDQDLSTLERAGQFATLSIDAGASAYGDPPQRPESALSPGIPEPAAKHR